MKHRKIFSYLTAAILSIAAFAGCSQDSAREMPLNETAAVNNYIAKESDSTVSGEVTKIVGNRITLALGSISENEKGGRKKESMSESEVEQSDFKGERPEMNGEMPDFGGERPEMNGEMPDFGGEKPEMNGEMPDFRGGRKSSSIKKSSEEAEYIIPVGMPVSGLGGRSSDYSGITEGVVITLTINEKGIVCAAEVN